MSQKTNFFAAATLLVLMSSPASADRQLAIGAAGGFSLPEGTQVRPVYTWPVGRRWEPADTTMGAAFREPIYATPRGYRYVYVRGYQVIKNPIRVASVVRVTPVSKGPALKVKKTVRRGVGACVTDIGYGRYEYCP